MSAEREDALEMGQWITAALGWQLEVRRWEDTRKQPKMRGKRDGKKKHTLDCLTLSPMPG